jgi:predicted kinase
MQEVILCKGVPASGKSTWAKALVKNSLMWKRINRDDLRAMLDNSIHTPTNESFVVRAQNFMLLEALKRGKNVVIDDTNFAYKNFKRACRIPE